MSANDIKCHDSIVEHNNTGFWYYWWYVTHWVNGTQNCLCNYYYTLYVIPL